MPTISVTGNSVYYLEFGDASLPPLILLHGLYGDSTSSAPLAEVLSPTFHVIAPDALGHGRSDGPEGYTLEDQGRMINGLITALGYESAAVVGISMGSYLAEQAAILDSGQISRLVLVVSKAHGKTSSVAAYAQRNGFDLANSTPEAMLEFMAGALWSKDTSLERRAEILSRQPVDAVELTPERKAAVERSLAGFDLRAALATVRSPTLVISGRDDGLNPPSSGEEVARQIPNSRFEVYEHSGHMLAAEETDRLVADIRQFVLG